MSEQSGPGRRPVEQAPQCDAATAQLRKLMLAVRAQFGVGEGVTEVRRRRRIGRQVGLLSEGDEFRLGRHRCFLIRRSAAKHLRSSLATIPSAPTWRAGNLKPSELHELALLFESLPERVLYVDLETCGLGDVPIFLLGVLRHERRSGEWVVEQYLARTYDEEPALLHVFWHLARRCTVLATFNGKSFDYPRLEDRSARYRIGRPRRRKRAQQKPGQGGVPGWVHCDLLYYARRLWRVKYDLPDCRLLTLEYCICGREREEDIEGSEMQRVYEEFVRTGHTSEMELVLEHNFHDLVTLADLSFRLLAEVGG